MKAIQFLLIALIIVAGIIAVICAMEYLPIEQEILPTWATNWLPALGAPEAGWLIFTVIAAIVVSGLLVGVVQRTIDRRNTKV